MQNLNTTMVVKNNKVVLGMSGGVDSTASALLLKKRGYEVYGLYFDVFGKPDSEGWRKAQAAAGRVKIPIVYRDVSKEFRTKIISSFHNEYVAGRTPNPCIICNKSIKFKVLFDEANAIGAYHVATGHYSSTMEKNGNYHIGRCAKNKKDQSYVLWKLSSDEIERIIFPLADLTSKQEVRAMLEDEGFECAADADSQEICFIEDNDYVKFLTETMGCKPVPGKFVDGEGNILGDHPGVISFTLGQRKGLGITFGKPAFVTKINAAKNEVVLGSNEDLFKNAVIASDCRISEAADLDNLKARVRYSSPLIACRITVLENGRVLTQFEEPQRAPTPGQSIVWYDGDLVAGGGIIDDSYNI